jgi:hypothetical protein
MYGLSDDASPISNRLLSIKHTYVLVFPRGIMRLCGDLSWEGCKVGLGRGLCLDDYKDGAIGSQ